MGWDGWTGLDRSAEVAEMVGRTNEAQHWREELRSEDEQKAEQIFNSGR